MKMMGEEKGPRRAKINRRQTSKEKMRGLRRYLGMYKDRWKGCNEGILKMFKQVRREGWENKCLPGVETSIKGMIL